MRVADFIQEYATAIAGTNGDGAVTLGQIAGKPRFSHAFPNGALVRYTIEDTVSGKLESGAGSVSGNVLTRTKPRTTWDGTTYNNKSATALQFGTPADSKVIVRLAQVADNAYSGVQGFTNRTFTGIDATWTQYPMSAHLTAWPAAQTQTISNSFDFFSYYKVEVGGSLQGLQFEITTAGDSSSVYKLALYELGIDGLPARKITDFPDVPCGPSTGVKTLADTSLWTPAEAPYLSPGWYAIAMKNNSATSTSVRAAYNTNSLIQTITPVGKTTSYAGYKNLITRNNGYDANAFPTVPDFTTGSPGVVSAVLWIGLKVVP